MSARRDTMLASSIAASVAERDFQQQVIDLAVLQGWLVYHTHDARRSQKGFPDICAVRDGQLVFLELKSQYGQASPEQLAWLLALEGVPGVTARLARPSDWPDLEDLLRRRTPKGA